MSQADEYARKKINDAIAALQRRWSEEAMRLPLTEDGENKRRELVRQFQLAGDVGKQIETEITRV